MPVLLDFMRFFVYNQHMENKIATVTIPKTEYESLKAEVAELTQKVNWFMEQFRLSQQNRFGPSSEKSSYTQLNLFNEPETCCEPSAIEPDIEEVKSYRRKKPRNSADRLPLDLPVETIEHELPEDNRQCPECDGTLHVMGRETREELKIVPATASITRHIRHVYACRHCEKTGLTVPIIKAPMPQPVIKGSFASPDSVAYIATQKFVMGIPLYRQEQEWERSGVLISRQTMCNWLIKSTEDWLVPIYVKLRELLCAGEVAHADETSLQVLHEPGKEAQSKSYMWLYRTSGDARHPIVLYEYQPSRSGKHPAEFLYGYKGFLHTDGYAAYHSGLPEAITVVGCWAHCRRKFDEALKAIQKKDQAGSNALRGKQYCDRLFELEREFAGLPPDDNYKARFDARINKSKPLMDEFFEWAAGLGVLPKLKIGEAIRYALDQKSWLERVLMDGRLELSNNRAERSIKPFVIGRKNWLFNNTPKGAMTSAIIYSLVETAKENKVNPYEYLTFVFRSAPNLPEGSSINDLLSWNMSGEV